MSHQSWSEQIIPTVEIDFSIMYDLEQNSAAAWGLGIEIQARNNRELQEIHQSNGAGGSRHRPVDRARRS